MSKKRKRTAKNLGGRPPIDPALRLSRKISVRFTEAEYSALLTRSNCLDSQLSSWIRATILDTTASEKR